MTTRHDLNIANPGVDRLRRATASARARVIGHPIYAKLDSVTAIATFMKYHVFAVWDSTSLLKSLQRNLTCVDVPWVPDGLAETRRLINEIVLVEESDILDGEVISHFELYRRAMTEASADTTSIDMLIDRVRHGAPVLSALYGTGAPPASAEFVTVTWGFIDNAPVHCQAAALAFGREDVIPEMFDQVGALHQDQRSELSSFVHYLRRHIQVDSEEHAPMVTQMIIDLCDNDDRKWHECEKTVETALNARVRLWDGALAAINSPT